MSIVLTASQSEAVEGILNALRSISDSAVRAATRASDRDERPEDTKHQGAPVTLPGDRQIISILGGRGSGKTTVLSETLRALAKLESPRLAVCAPLVPESFLALDGALAWVIASVQKLAEDVLHRLEDDSGGRSVVAPESSENRGVDRERLRERLRRFSWTAELALSRKQDNSTLLQESLLQKADDAGALARAGFDLRDRLSEVLDSMFQALCENSDEEAGALLIIACDDVDLLPERFQNLLPLLHVLASIPRVVVLLAADEALIRAQLTASAMQFFPEREAAAQDLAESQLKKILPHHLRFQIRRLEAKEILRFRALSAPTDIRGVFSSVRFREFRTGPKCLLDLFEVSLDGVTGSLTQFVDFLPRDPRSLVQLDALLRRLINAPEGDEHASWLAAQDNRVIVEQLLLFLFRCDPTAPPEVRALFDFSDPDRIVIHGKGFQSGVAAERASVTRNGWEARWCSSLTLWFGEHPLSPSHVALGYMVTVLRAIGVEAIYEDQRLYLPGPQSAFRFFVNDEDQRVGWPIAGFVDAWTQARMQLGWKNAVNRYVDRSRPGLLAPAGEDLEYEMSILFYEYCLSILLAPLGEKSDLGATLGEANPMMDEPWEALVGFAGAVLAAFEADIAGSDPLALANRRVMETWAAEGLVWVRDSLRGLGIATAERVGWLREKILDALGIPASERAAAEARAALSQKRAMSLYPQAKLDEVDVEEMTENILRGDKGAVARAMLILQEDRSPSAARKMLATVLTAIGIPDSAIPREEGRGLGGPASPEDQEGFRP